MVVVLEEVASLTSDWENLFQLPLLVMKPLATLKRVSTLDGKIVRFMKELYLA